MQFSTLFLISLFSVSLALSGCVGSDNETVPKKPGNSQNNGDVSTPDNGDGNTGGENTGEENGNDQTPSLPIPGTPNAPSDGNTPTEPVDCEAPEASQKDTSLGDVGDPAKYTFAGYTEVTGTSNLTGTWLVIGDNSAKGSSLDDPSVSLKQKYFLVIKSIDSDTYGVSNCTGVVSRKDITAEQNCVDINGKEVNCENSNQVSIGTEYLPWTGYSNKKVKNNEINIPVSLAGEASFEVVSNSYLRTADNHFSAKKISTDTSSLGSFSVNSSKQDKTTKRVYYKELTEKEITDFKKIKTRKDIAKLKVDDIAEYSFIDLTKETYISPKVSSTFNDMDLSCISQQVMHVRQCTNQNAVNSNGTEDTLAAVSATTTGSFHLLFAAANDIDNNTLTVQNLSVTAGKTTNDSSVGTDLTSYEDIMFAKERTEDVTNLSLEFQASTSNKDTNSYQTGFSKMCSPTEDNYLSGTGGSCDEKDKKLYKTLLETKNTIILKEADIKIAPKATLFN